MQGSVPSCPGYYTVAGFNIALSFNSSTMLINTKNRLMVMVMVMNLYSTFSILIYLNALYKYVTYGKRPDHNSRNSVPYYFDECVGSLTPPASHYSEDAEDGTYGLLSLSEKTRMFNHLQMSLQRHHILLNYFKTLSVGPVWGSNPRPPAR